jgi:Flp pilus assembly protein TadG
MVEFALIVPMLLILVSASIDFGRALYTMQVMAELTRQGSNLASRDDTLPNAVSALIAGESGLNIGTYGEVIITQVTNTGTTASPTYTMTGQATGGGLVEASRVGTYSSSTGAKNTATMPAAFVAGTLQASQSTYITEIFYQFTPITPLLTLTKNWPKKGAAGIGLPSMLYDYTYF